MTELDKEIARDILIKLLEMKVIYFEPAHGNTSLEEKSKINDRNSKTVCDTYEKILQTVAKSNI